MNLSKLLLLICISFSSIVYGQRKNVYSRNDIPAGWVVTDLVCVNLNCTYSIENISGLGSRCKYISCAT